MTKALLLLIVCFAGLSLQGQVKWLVDIKEDNTGPKLRYQYFLTGITYKNTKGTWTIDAPAKYAEKWFDVRMKNVDINQLDGPQPFLFGKPYSNSSIVVIPFTIGLMVLDAKTGKQMQWFEYKLDGQQLRPSVQDGYWFDDGNYSITCGKDTYKSELVYEANFLQKYKQYLLNFNGHHLYILNEKDGKLMDKVETEKRWAEKARVYATARWKKMIVNWDGIIYR